MFDVRRREFITLLGGAAAAWPVMSFAQTNNIRRVAVFMPWAEDDIEIRPRVVAVRAGLRELGWVEGTNIELVGTSKNCSRCRSLTASERTLMNRNGNEAESFAGNFVVCGEYGLFFEVPSSILPLIISPIRRSFFASSTVVFCLHPRQHLPH